MALSTADAQPEPYGSERGRPIQDLFVTELLGIGAAFTVGEGIAIEAGGHQGIEILVRYEVARKLLDGELIEGEVAIERIDDPLAIPPGPWPCPILFVAVAVRVAGQVQPETGPFLAIMRR